MCLRLALLRRCLAYALRMPRGDSRYVVVLWCGKEIGRTGVKHGSYRPRYETHFKIDFAGNAEFRPPPDAEMVLQVRWRLRGPGSSECATVAHRGAVMQWCPAPHWRDPLNPWLRLRAGVGLGQARWRRSHFTGEAHVARHPYTLLPARPKARQVPARLHPRRQEAGAQVRPRLATIPVSRYQPTWRSFAPPASAD